MNKNNKNEAIDTEIEKQSKEIRSVLKPLDGSMQLPVSITPYAITKALSVKTNIKQMPLKRYSRVSRIVAACASFAIIIAGSFGAFHVLRNNQLISNHQPGTADSAKVTYDDIYAELSDIKERFGTDKTGKTGQNQAYAYAKADESNTVGEEVSSTNGIRQEPDNTNDVSSTASLPLSLSPPDTSSDRAVGSNAVSSNHPASTASVSGTAGQGSSKPAESGSRDSSGAQTSSDKISDTDSVPGLPSDTDVPAVLPKESIAPAFGITNIQVPGIDEADIIKNDGSHLYVISSGEYSNRKLSVLKIEDSGEIVPESICYTGFIGKAAEMYVCNDMVLIIGPMTGGLDVDTWSTPEENTLVELYDISDRKNMKRTGRFLVQGKQISSRLSGENLYLATNPIFRDLTSLTEENIKNYMPRIKNKGVKENISDTLNIVEPDKMQIVKGTEIASYCLTFSLKLSDFTKEKTQSESGPVQLCSVLGSGGILYADENAMYTASVKQEKADAVTEILRYDFTENNPSVTYTGRAILPGKVHDSFAMDETNGVLRVVTFDGYEYGIYTLNRPMETIGKLESYLLEEISGIRYLSDTLYLMTKSGRLLKYDLSDSYNPKQVGSLTFSGFSSYLQPVSMEYAITLGMHEVADGRKVLSLEMFNISDTANPADRSQVLLQGAGLGNIDSAALEDHRAFGFIPERNLILIPFTEGKFSGIYVVHADMAEDTAGLTVEAIISCQNFSTVKDEYECTRGTVATRSTWAGDVGYAISDSRIVSFSLNDHTLLDSVNLYEVEALGSTAFTSIKDVPVISTRSDE